jgi:hypothetical protein
MVFQDDCNMHVNMGHILQRYLNLVFPDTGTSITLNHITIKNINCGKNLINYLHTIPPNVAKFYNRSSQFQKTHNHLLSVMKLLLLSLENI